MHELMPLTLDIICCHVRRYACPLVINSFGVVTDLVAAIWILGQLLSVVDVHDAVEAWHTLAHVSIRLRLD